MAVGSGRRARGRRVEYVVFFVLLGSLLLCPSIVRAFHLLSFRTYRRCRCLTRRLAVEEPTAAAPTAAEPTAPHSIVSGSHGLFCCKCGETENFKNTCKATAAEYAATKIENEAQRTAAHALELARIKAAAKADFARNATSIFIACLTLAVVCFFSREVRWWVKATVIPLLNSTREKLLLTTGGLVGFVAGLFTQK